MKHLLLICLIITSYSSYARTWTTAMPYTQKVQGQHVIIKAASYSPYGPSPTLGSTEVYYKKKLLYKIDKYFREPVYTSSNGEYLAVVHITNANGITSYTQFGIERIDFEQNAIDIYKNGTLYKEVKLWEVIDTSKLANNGTFFYWGYNINYDAYRNAQFGCDACIEVYGKKILKKCDTNEIDIQECIECRQGCDSIKQRDIELKIVNNSVFVKNNQLHVVTNQNTVVKLDFKNLQITKEPFSNVITDKSVFNPPKTRRKYANISMPDKFAEPNLIDGTTLEQAINKHLKAIDSSVHTIHIYTLFIDNNGNVKDFYGYVSNKTDSEVYDSYKKRNTKLTEILKEWIMHQRFETKLIPKKFKGYKFLVYLTM